MVLMSGSPLGPAAPIWRSWRPQCKDMGQRQALGPQRLGTVALAVIIRTEEKWSGTSLRVFSVAHVAECSLWPPLLAPVFFTSLLLVPSSRAPENASALKSLLYHP